MNYPIPQMHPNTLGAPGMPMQQMHSNVLGVPGAPMQQMHSNALGDGTQHFGGVSQPGGVSFGSGIGFVPDSALGSLGQAGYQSSAMIQGLGNTPGLGHANHAATMEATGVNQAEQAYKKQMAFNKAKAEADAAEARKKKLMIGVPLALIAVLGIGKKAGWF